MHFFLYLFVTFTTYAFHRPSSFKNQHRSANICWKKSNFPLFLAHHRQLTHCFLHFITLSLLLITHTQLPFCSPFDHLWSSSTVINFCVILLLLFHSGMFLLYHTFTYYYLSTVAFLLRTHHFGCPFFPWLPLSSKLLSSHLLSFAIHQVILPARPTRLNQMTVSISSQKAYKPIGRYHKTSTLSNNPPWIQNCLARCAFENCDHCIRHKQSTHRHHASPTQRHRWYWYNAESKRMST